MATLAERICEPRGENEGVAVHLEVDLFTYRSIMAVAEKYNFHFRFFPTPIHYHFDQHRRECELIGDVTTIPMPGDRQRICYTVNRAIEDLPTERPTRKLRYEVVAYCPTCAKLLPPDTRLQCSRCRIAFYCNIECQKTDWDKLHKQECKKFRKLVAEAGCGYCTEEGEMGLA